MENENNFNKALEIAIMGSDQIERGLKELLNAVYLLNKDKKFKHYGNMLDIITRVFAYAYSILDDILKSLNKAEYEADFDKYDNNTR